MYNIVSFCGGVFAHIIVKKIFVRCRRSDVNQMERQNDVCAYNK